MYHQDQSELILEADFLWREIHVGDQIYLDADLYKNSRRLLCKGAPYQVVAKLDSVSGAQELIVQSYQTNELVPVSPYLICSYDSPDQPVLIS
ncbi:hypothetical protein [Amphritea balenae]|uniref:Uncharacterized protein n=1 Tax=Amphritea balenae TaxID=452629 RepID=A0A3P1SLE6_9GAMM|nr:hypothetical protein [Amphritea balenae]RRC97946.1 hypothetical protein EHS89_15305 [Amphritea balenae]GGK82007.1 hypothetical protein GCM10007941_35530 [Amphritea balenae]